MILVSRVRMMTMDLQLGDKSVLNRIQMHLVEVTTTYDNPKSYQLIQIKHQTINDQKQDCLDVLIKWTRLLFNMVNKYF